MACVGCGGGGRPSAIDDYAKSRWPAGKVLSCENTGQVAEAGKVWQCAVRVHNETGRYASDLNKVADSTHPPVVVCVAVRGDAARAAAC